MKLRRFGKLIGLLVLVGGLATGCGGGEETPEEVTSAPTPVQVAQVEVGSIKELAELTGTVAAKQMVAVLPKGNGRVAQVNMQVGQRVNKGDLLVRLEADELALQLRQAEANLAGIQAQLDQTKRGIKAEDLKVLEARYQNTKLNYERMKSLHEAGAIPLSQVEEVEMGFLDLENQYQQAVKGPDPDDLAALESNVAAAKASVELMRTQINNTSVTAPITGVIASTNVQLGDMAGASGPVATIVNIDTVEVSVNVSEGIVNLVRPQDPVQVMVAAASAEPLAGVVLTVSPAADPQTRQFAVKVSLPNEEGLLKPGMFAQVQLLIGQAEEALIIPKEALINAFGINYVYVVENEQAERREVELGLENQHTIQITKGLASGEKVVVKGQNRLESGQFVTIESGGEQ